MSDFTLLLAIVTSYVPCLILLGFVFLVIILFLRRG